MSIHHSAPGTLAREDGVLAGFVSFAVSGVAGQARLEGYLSRPDDGKSYPGVVVIQEWWGIEPHIQDMARRLAKAGYVTLAPDLYHGKVATEPNEAMKHVMALNKDKAVVEIQQAVAYLKSRDDVEPKKIGIVGFCMGGLLTWRVAEAEDGEIAAIAPFYAGHFNPTAEDIREVTAPALVVWGQHDTSTSQSERDRIVNLLQTEGKTHRVLVYEAGHAFMNDSHPTYSKPAADQAWAELLAWFKKYL